MSFAFIFWPILLLIRECSAKEGDGEVILVGVQLAKFFKLALRDWYYPMFVRCVGMYAQHRSWIALCKPLNLLNLPVEVVVCDQMLFALSQICKKNFRNGSLFKTAFCLGFGCLKVSHSGAMCLTRRRILKDTQLAPFIFKLSLNLLVVIGIASKFFSNSENDISFFREPTSTYLEILPSCCLFVVVSWLIVYTTFFLK